MPYAILSASDSASLRSAHRCPRVGLWHPRGCSRSLPRWLWTFLPFRLPTQRRREVFRPSSGWKHICEARWPKSEWMDWHFWRFTKRSQSTLSFWLTDLPQKTADWCSCNTLSNIRKWSPQEKNFFSWNDAKLWLWRQFTVLDDDRCRFSLSTWFIKWQN